MKKILLTTIAFITIGYMLSAQSTPSYFFDLINLGSSDINAMYGEYADLGGGGNWGVLTGTPSYISPTEANITMTSGIYPDIQSVFKRFHFAPNTNYKVFLGVRDFEQSGSGETISLKVLLANNLVATTSPQPNSAPSLSSSRLLYNYSGPGFQGSGTGFLVPNSTYVELEFSTGDNESYDNIVMYPEGLTHYNVEPECFLVIGCLQVYSCPANDLYYSGATIPTGVSRGQSVYIGSSYGTTNTLTSSNTSQATNIYGATKIVLANNTVLTAGTGTPVNLSIDYCYGYETYTNDNVDASVVGGYCDGTQARPAHPANLSEAALWKQIGVFPNPTSTNEFSVNNPFSGILLVDLYDLSGRKINSKSILPNSTDHFAYRELPKGMYFLKTSYHNQSKTFKIVFD